MPAIENGSLLENATTGNFVLNGTKLQFKCSAGFNVANDKVRPECYNGTWLHAPQCIPGRQYST